MTNYIVAFIHGDYEDAEQYNLCVFQTEEEANKFIDDVNNLQLKILEVYGKEHKYTHTFDVVTLHFNPFGWSSLKGEELASWKEWVKKYAANEYVENAVYVIGSFDCGYTLKTNYHNGTNNKIGDSDLASCLFVNEVLAISQYPVNK